MRKGVLFLMLVASHLCSMGQSSFNGMWVGKLNAGVTVRVVFTIKQDSAQKYSVIIEWPDQGIKGMSAREVQVINDSISINMGLYQIVYSGKLINDSIIKGTWRQGAQVALELKKIDKIEVIHRSQTPVPPFPYRSEDVIYTNKDKTIQYGATITTPNGKGPFPAVILITGSGQQNRDEEIIGHKPFAVIADHLTRNGFAVMRVDDRGMGQSTGEVMSATTRDFCDDVSNGIDYLKTRKEIDKKRLGLVGHSEGAMIAQALAAENKDIAAIVLLAGPGKSGMEVMIEQNRAIFTKAGFSKEYVDRYTELYAAIVGQSKNIDDKQALKTAVAKQVDDWLAKTNKAIAMATTGIINDDTKNEFVKQFTEALSSPWIRYFLNFEPEQYLQKVSCKVFALNGAKDIQIIPGQNLPAIEAALKKSNSSGYKIREYPGLNHMFQTCKACTVQEYGQLDETISVEVLQDVAAWLKSAL